jgi:hypothetical protein
MKKLFKDHRILLMTLLVAVSPFYTSAQSWKETYLRPSYWRPYSQSGINVYETSKARDSIAYDGMRMRLGAGFTQQFQGLKHRNANNKDVTNRLYPLTPGFNTAMANLNVDVQLAEGIRLNLVTYLSSRHHNETWVKGGYIQFDKLPLKGKLWNELMEIATLKIGHMEINYGDAHFRRSDGGQTIYNPFIENYIVDAFATEIGGEIYLQKYGMFGMVGLTNGMIKGNVDSMVATAQDKNIRKSPAIYVKGGFDQDVNEKVRLRATVSLYHNGSSGGNTLFNGDRAGSNYFMVMEKAGSTYSGQATSGRFNPGFSKKVLALQWNWFAKLSGLEIFVTYETAKGRTKTETGERKMKQFAGDVVYRIGIAEKAFVGARYNAVKARPAAAATDIKINRYALAGGWFLTRNILLKGELVNQQYKNFSAADYRNGGRFNGYVIEAVVGF